MVELNGSDERMEMANAMSSELARSFDIARFVVMMDVGEYLKAHPEVVEAFNFLSDLEEKIRDAAEMLRDRDVDGLQPFEGTVAAAEKSLRDAHSRVSGLLAQLVYDRIPKRKPLAT